MHLLGGVDEQEEERKGAGRDRGTLERQGVDAGDELVERGRSRLVVPPSAARLPERFDRVEGGVSLDLADDATQRRREPPDVVVERTVLGANVWRLVRRCYSH
jgi:hypothetical protein